MGFFPDIFADPKLVQRQAALDAQWRSVNGIVNTCTIPSSAWTEWVGDFDAWSNFLDSESNWSSGSKTATDEWTSKLQEWTRKIASYGCTGLSEIDGLNVISARGQNGGAIPTVKDPPPNDPGYIDEALGVISKVTQPARDAISTVGYVVVGVIVLIVLALVYILTRGQASGFGLTLGDGKTS